MVHRLSVVWFAVACTGFTLPAQLNASGGELIAEQAAFDVQHYDLALAVDPAQRAIEGRLTMTARIVRDTQELALDLDGRLTVAAVTSAGAAADFEHRDGRIWIRLREAARAGQQVEIAIEYGGQPREAPMPPWDGGFTWAKAKDGSPWIATSCQGEGADLWWPCKDHPSDKPETMDLHFTVPRGLFCASNGTLKSTEQRSDGTRTFHWHVANPISNYCVALNVGPFVALERSFESVTGETIPVFFWVLPEHKKQGERILPEFLDHLRHLEEVCGPYPFRNEKYGIVETPHLGMEHQTCIAYGNRFQKGPFAYDWLHHHELSHEWWGNLVTCRDWKDMWLHEGFGSYMQALYIERKHGRKAYLVEMRTKRGNLGNNRPVAPRETRDSKQIYFDRSGSPDNDIYGKGSCILHTLRWLIGDDAFFQALRRMAYPDPERERVTDGSQVRLVDTEDFRAVAEAASGRDLAWFFDVYLRQPLLPELIEERQGDVLKLRWRVPGDIAFPMPVPVEIDGEVRRVEMSEGSATVDLQRGRKVDVDPEGWVLAANR